MCSARRWPAACPAWSLTWVIRSTSWGIRGAALSLMTCRGLRSLWRNCSRCHLLKGQHWVNAPARGWRHISRSARWSSGIRSFMNSCWRTPVLRLDKNKGDQTCAASPDSWNPAALHWRQPQRSWVPWRGGSSIAAPTTAASGSILRTGSRWVTGAWRSSTFRKKDISRCVQPMDVACWCSTARSTTTARSATRSIAPARLPPGAGIPTPKSCWLPSMHGASMRRSENLSACSPLLCGIAKHARSSSRAIAWGRSRFTTAGRAMRFSSGRS